MGIISSLASVVMKDNRLLIVDDDKDTCSNLSDILTDCGYSVDVANGGQHALDFFKQHPYRLVLLDYNLPDINGVSLFRQMRQIRDGIEGLLVTGFASNETEKEAVAVGLRQVVTKPVEMFDFMPLVEQALA